MKLDILKIIFFITCAQIEIINASFFTPKIAETPSIQKNSSTQKASQTNTFTSNTQKQHALNSRYTSRTETNYKNQQKASISSQKNPLATEWQTKSEILKNEFEIARNNYFNDPENTIMQTKGSQLPSLQKMHQAEKAYRAHLENNPTKTTQPTLFSSLKNTLNTKELTTDIASSFGPNPSKKTISDNLQTMINKIKTSMNLDVPKEQLSKITQTIKQKLHTLAESPTVYEIQKFIENSMNLFKKNGNKTRVNQQEIDLANIQLEETYTPIHR